jgi:hypothetical protein
MTSEKRRAGSARPASPVLRKEPPWLASLFAHLWFGDGAGAPKPDAQDPTPEPPEK